MLSKPWDPIQETGMQTLIGADDQVTQYDYGPTVDVTMPGDQPASGLIRQLTFVSGEAGGGAVLSEAAGAVVFVSNCWLTDEEGTPGPMLEALLRGNPRAVIGGGGRNFAGIDIPRATDLLGLYVRFFLGLGFGPANALRFAKARLRCQRRSRYTEDTLAFGLWTPDTLPSTEVQCTRKVRRTSHQRRPTCPL